MIVVKVFDKLLAEYVAHKQCYHLIILLDQKVNPADKPMTNTMPRIEL